MKTVVVVIPPQIGSGFNLVTGLLGLRVTGINPAASTVCPAQSRFFNIKHKFEPISQMYYSSQSLNAYLQLDVSLSTASETIHQLWLVTEWLHDDKSFLTIVELACHKYCSQDRYITFPRDLLWSITGNRRGHHQLFNFLRPRPLFSSYEVV